MPGVMAGTGSTASVGPKPISNRTSSLVVKPGTKITPPDDPKTPDANATNVRISRPKNNGLTPKREVKGQPRGTVKTLTPSRAKTPITPMLESRLNRSVTLPPPTRPPPPIPTETNKHTLKKSTQPRTATSVKAAGTKTPPKTAWVLSSATRTTAAVPAGKRVSSAPPIIVTPHPPASTPATNRPSAAGKVTSNLNTPSRIPRKSPSTLQLSQKSNTSSQGSVTPPRRTTPLRTKETLPNKPSTRIPASTQSASKLIRRTSVRAKIRPQVTPSKRPAPLDLSKTKSPPMRTESIASSSSKYTTPSSSIPVKTPEKQVTTATNVPSSSPLRIERVLNELRESHLTPSSTGSFRSALSSPHSPGTRTIDTYRTSEDISIRKSPVYQVFLVPNEEKQLENNSRRGSDGTIFDEAETKSSIASPPLVEDQVSAMEDLNIPEPSPSSYSSSPRRHVSGSRRSSKSPRSSVGKMFDFGSTTKITRRRPPSFSLSTRSALEASLGTIVSASISTINSAHVRKHSADNMIPIPTPDTLLQETKRLRTRYKIINEIVQTEVTFIQDMHVLNDYYYEFSNECPLLSARQKQTIFGRIKGILSFGDSFQRELKKAAGDYADLPEGQVVEARLDELLDWDGETTIGETFWSSMVRIEKAYSGYCTHHEEASQTLQELEKNETVKLWLEECKRRSQSHTKAWDIHSLIIKPVQRVLKYPLLLQELLNVTPWSHSDYGSLELANKEITRVAERINESKRRKEICDRILAKGRKAASSINADLVKLGRRSDKIRSSFGVASDWQDETSELYCDLVSKFAKQAIQVQVLARDFERWLKEYRVYLNSADTLMAALKSWVTLEHRLPDAVTSEFPSWNKFFIHVDDVSIKIFPVLEKTIQNKCKLYDSFKGPAALIAKHDRKAVDFARYMSLKSKDETPDKKLVESADTFKSLHESLLEELPIFLSLTGEFIEAIVNQFSLAQAAWYNAWTEELAKITTDPFLEEKATPEAFAGIVTDFLEHFEAQKEVMDSFSILNGYAIKHASRAPSVARLASEEQARFADSRTSGIISPPLMTGSPGRSPRIHTGGELPGYFPASSPLSFKDHQIRFGSFDSATKSPELLQHHRFLFRACSLVSFTGSSGRADGFPFLSFSTGQEFDVVVEKDDRWLARIPGSDEIGWIPKSHCIEILM